MPHPIETEAMKYYQHDFSKVESYLHHRAPYLLVDRIESISDRAIETEKTFTGEELFTPGHFPGAPIFPGAMMQELSTQSAGILIAARYNPMQEFNTEDPFFNALALGVLVRVDHAKYTGFARPGDTLSVKVTLTEHLEALFDFSSSITIGGKVIMRNAFRLANIDSNRLQAG